MQARNFTTNVPKILDLKSSSEQIFFRKLSLGAPDTDEPVSGSESGPLNRERANTKTKREETAPPTFRVPFAFASAPLSESLEQAIHIQSTIPLFF